MAQGGAHEKTQCGRNSGGVCLGREEFHWDEFGLQEELAPKGLESLAQPDLQQYGMSGGDSRMLLEEGGDPWKGFVQGMVSDR